MTYWSLSLHRNKSIRAVSGVLIRLARGGDRSTQSVELLLTLDEDRSLRG